MPPITEPPTGGKGQIRPPHLRLIHPSPPKPSKRRYRKRPPIFTIAETQRLQAALRHARALFGTWACAADALRVVKETLLAAASGRAPVSAEVAVRLAKALGKPLDALLSPPTDAGRCPTCGASRGAP
jgi:hypothetical protein